MVTGRKPWTSATSSDPDFRRYLRDPMGFLPAVLPVSPELNEVLIRMLDVDWRQRSTLREVRYAMEEVTSLYSDGVVFEGSMARCPWEAGMDIDSVSTGTTSEDADHQSPDPRSLSRWSKDSTSDIISANEPSDGGPPPCTWNFDSSVSSNSDPWPRIYDANTSIISESSSTTMHTAIEYDPLSSMFSLGRPISPSNFVMIPASALIAIGDDKERMLDDSYSASLCPKEKEGENSTSEQSMGWGEFCVVV